MTSQRQDVGFGSSLQSGPERHSAKLERNQALISQQPELGGEPFLSPTGEAGKRLAAEGCYRLVAAACSLQGFLTW